MDIIDIMELLGTTTLAVVSYIFIFHRTSHRKNGHYTIPNWNFFLKKRWVQRLLLKNQRTNDAQFSDFLNFKSENHKQLELDTNHSGHLFYGNDANGNSLLVNLTKGKDNNAEVWLILRLSNGTIFTLPEHPNTIQRQIKNNVEKITIGGLTLQCMLPYKKWRITYTGLMHRGVPTNLTTLEYPENELELVKFNFFWTACAEPQHWPGDWSTELKASALATEPWRNGQWLNYLSTADFEGYDQFGNLHGEINLTDTETIELNLPGLRQMRWYSYEMEKIRRSCQLIGVCPDGCIFILGAVNMKNNLTNAQFGYLRSPNGKVFPIDWTDFQLRLFAENYENIPHALSVQFSANNKMYTTVVYCKRSEKASLFGTIPQKWISNVIPLEVGINGITGQGLAILKYTISRHNQLPISDENLLKLSPKPPALSYNDDKPKKLQICYDFTERECQNVSITGGKGASLSLLTTAQKNTNLSYQVPAGFVVTVAALDIQLNKNRQLLDMVNQIKNIAYEITDGSLEKICQETVMKFQEIVLEPEIIQAITDSFLELLKKTNTTTNNNNNNNNNEERYAVRSSAIGEDSEDASSAGQNETFLGLHNIEQILNGVRKCWASLFTYRSVEYRRQHIQPIDSSMAVVVQKMIPSDVAGVMFTQHPTDGNPSKILITANYGLGESVVSGTVEPDTFTITRNYLGNEYKITDVTLGSKLHAYKMSNQPNDGNVLLNQISQIDQQKSCLNDNEILELVEIGCELERLYGNSRDIEWAIWNNEIYLLQARPITTINSLTNWELLHEMDESIMSKDDLWSFGNVGEVFPTAVTPLTNSTVCRSLVACTQQFVDGNEVPRYPETFSIVFPIFRHRLVVDVYKIFLKDRDRELSVTDEIGSISVSGRKTVTPEYHRISVHRNGIAKASKKLQLLWNVVKGAWVNKSNVEADQKFIASLKNRYSKENILKDFKDYDAASFFDEINFEWDDPDRMDRITNFHTSSSMVSSFSQVVSLLFLVEGGKTVTSDHYADFSLMVSSCKDVESAEVPTMLEDICNEIYMANVTKEFISIEPKDGEEFLEKMCPNASRKFRNFINRHSHRSIKEFDFLTITWGMKPDIIIEMLQATCRHSNELLLSDKPPKRELTNQEIIKMLKTPKKKFTKFILSKLLTLCQLSVQRRESTKSCLVAYIHELRKAYHHLADLMFREGLLPKRSLIFFLTRNELACLLSKPGDRTMLPIPNINKIALINKAQRRMRLYPIWCTYRYEELNEGILQPINDEVYGFGGDGNDTVVNGTSVTEGIITGRACVIENFSDVGLIEAGDILITNSTDIGWSPYFPILGGVVTELGGLISHGAVVAREYGLPCIVGAVGATRKLKFGDLVTLNATKGIIFKVNDNNNESNA